MHIIFRILPLLLFFILFSNTQASFNTQDSQSTSINIDQGKDECQKMSMTLDTNNTLAEFADIYEKQGCCSWHSGVCGCSYGRALCCDGTLSPSCGC